MEELNRELNYKAVKTMSMLLILYTKTNNDDVMNVIGVIAYHLARCKFLLKYKRSCDQDIRYLLESIDNANRLLEELE